MGTRNDDISLILAKAKKQGFLPDVYDSEVDILRTEAKNMFTGDSVIDKSSSGIIRLASLGDSLTACDNGAVYDSISKNVKSSWLSFAAMLSNGKIQYGGNFGIPAESSTTILSRVSDVIAAKPTHCVVTAGANDGNATLSVSNTLAICEKLRTAGIIPLIGNRPPREDSAHAEQGNIRYQNEGLRKVAAENNITLIDFNKVLVDPATGLFIPGTYIDAVHPNPKGWELMAKEVLTAFDLSKINASYVRTDHSDFGAELISNGLFYNWSGDAPQYWSLAENVGGGSVSQVADTRFIGGNCLQISSPASAEVSQIVRYTINATAGHVIELGYKVFSAGTHGLDSRTVRILALTNDYATVLGGMELRGADTGGQFNFRYTAPANGVIIFDIRVQQGSGNATTHRFGNVTARNLTALGAA